VRAIVKQNNIIMTILFTASQALRKQMVSSVGNKGIVQKRKGYARHGMFNLMFNMCSKSLVHLGNHGESITLRRLGVSTGAVFMLMILGTTEISKFNNKFTKS
jgi:hypothetical protein